MYLTFNCLSRFIGYFAITTAATASVILFVGSVIDHDEYHIEHTIEVNAVALFAGMGDIIFAYAGQSVYPTVQHDMRNPDDFTKSVMWGYGVRTFPFQFDTRRKPHFPKLWRLNLKFIAWY